MRPPSAPPRRILVRGPNPVGDLVMATGAFADLRRSFPEARIALLLKPGRAALVEGAGLADELLVDDSHEGPRAFFRLVRTLRRGRFDRAVVFTHSLRSALAMAAAGVRERVGYPKGGQGPLLHRRVPPERDGRRWRPVPMPEIYGRLIAAAGAERGDGRPVLAVPEELEARYRERRRALGIGAGEELIGVVPGASFGASKLWPAERLAEVADRLGDEHGLRALVLGAPGEEPIVETLVARMRRPPVHTLGQPLDLALLKPFVRDLRLLVTMDTGPRHVATAFGVPALCILGPTDPRWTAAHLERQEIVRHDVPCGPCQLPVCPLDHRCLREIEVDEVLEHVRRLDRRVGVFGASAG